MSVPLSMVSRETTQPAKPQKRRRQKQELEYLRLVVKDLEEQITQLQAKQPTGKTEGLSFWKGVAEYQKLERTRAEEENRGLRASLEKQNQLITEMEQLRQKEEALTAERNNTIPDTVVRLTDDEIFADQLAHLERAHLDVDEVFAVPDFTDRAASFCNLHLMEDSKSDAGVTFVSKTSSLLPFDVQLTEKAVWCAFAEEGPKKMSYFIDERTVTEDLVARSYGIKYDAGSLRMNALGKQTYRKYVADDCVVIMWKSHTEPVEINITKLSGLQCTQIGWIVLRDINLASKDQQTDTSLSLVSTSLQSYCKMTLDLKDVTGGGEQQAREFTNFVISAHDFGAVATRPSLKNSMPSLHPSLVKPKKNSPIPGQELPGASKKLNVESVLIQLLLASAVCVCLSWTLWLMALNVKPNATVNKLMNTENFDNGVFWMVVDPSSTMLGLAMSGFSVVVLGYLTILVRIVFTRTPVHPGLTSLLQKGSVKEAIMKVKSAQNSVSDKLTSLLADHIRRNFNLGMKFTELILQAFLLYQMLESGTPVVLVIVFTAVIICNTMFCAVVMLTSFENTRLIEALCDTLFSLHIAIGLPIISLLYCVLSFTFDHAKYAINLDTFPPGWLEQSASMIANPVQTAIIYKVLKSLRITSVWEFFTHVGVHIMLCFQFHRTVGIAKNPLKQRGSGYPKRQYRGPALLGIFVALLVAFVEESVRTAAIACQPHPECAVNVHRWVIIKKGSLVQCPCLILIDREVAPKTYAEWNIPHNVTDKVAQLAATGDLEGLELLNRYLPMFPEELRRCTKLKRLSLGYTNTQVMPSWIGEFTELEFLNIESKDNSPVVFMPDSMFDDMGSLAFMHLAGFITTKRLPSFHGLVHLKSLTLAAFLLLEEIPTFDNLRNLERLVLSILPSIDSLPDFAPLERLVSFAVADRGAWCCNGFLGTCNLKDPKCGVHPLWQTPAATCLATNGKENIATAATLAVVKKFSAFVCGDVLRPGMLETPPTPDAMGVCDGTMYKQCEGPGGKEAMCFNTRSMGIACTASPFPIMMRRKQIAQGVGDACDPVVEAWLGCK
ncbi:hypothetical protein ON010_g1952 [Phytophthora cinnamomi]|nr:hypothetical protein ON010_g1952 [Phytophthora cinnamomi]